MEKTEKVQKSRKSRNSESHSLTTLYSELKVKKNSFGVEWQS